MSSVHEINRIDELAGCRVLWNALLPQTANATFFHSFDWLEVDWRHSGHDQRLRALIVSAGGRPIGILPLVVRTETTRLGPVRVLTYPLHGRGTFYGPIGPNPTATLLLGLKHVRQTRRDWDLLDLRWVDAAGCDLGRTRRAMQLAGFRPREEAWSQAAVVDTSGAWDEYWNSRTEAWRHKLGRCRRRLAERGELKYIRHRPEGDARGDGDPRWDLYEACARLAGNGRQRASTAGSTPCQGSAEQHLREIHAQAAGFGALDLNLLLIHGNPAAFAYNYHYRGSVLGLRTGSDPGLAVLEPETVLQRLALEDSFRRGDRRYDLGADSPESRRDWPTSVLTSFRYTHFPAAAPRAQLLRLKRWFQDRFCRASQTAAPIVANSAVGW